MKWKTISCPGPARYPSRFSTSTIDICIEKTDRTLKEIKLYVIDTTLFPRGTFLCDLDLIHAFRDFDNHPLGSDLANVQFLRNKPDYYFGEYLSQGSLRIENKCQVISGQCILGNNRLRRLQPQFTDLYSIASNGEVQWANEVVRLRREIWSGPYLRPLSSAEMRDRLQAVEEIVRDVAPGWKYPLAVYFAALIGVESATAGQGTAIDNVFFEYFRSESFDDPQGQQGLRPSNLNIIAPDTMPELKHVEKLVREIHKHSNLTRALDHVQVAEESLRDLHVQIVNAEDENALAAADENEGLARAGQALLSKLRAVPRLCEEVAVAISPDEA